MTYYDRCLKAFITVGNADATDLSLVFVVSTFTLRNGKQYRQINAILKLIRCLRRMPMRNWLHMWHHLYVQKMSFSYKSL